VSTGFTNVLTDTDSTTGNSITPVCDVSISDFTFVGMAEQSDWTSPMVATFTGTITAEKSCDSVTAKVQLYSNETSNFVGTSDPTLTKVDDYTYTFTTTIDGPNEYGNFSGYLTAWDSDNAADKANAASTTQLFAPPCYLQVVSFSKLS